MSLPSGGALVGDVYGHYPKLGWRRLVMEFFLERMSSWEVFWVFFYGFATYGNAGFMREQVCKYMCPYARFQSAMFDADTLVVTYDTERGEPRGARSRKADRLGDGRRAGLETMRRRVVGHRVPRDRLDHLAAAGVGRQVLEPFTLSVKRADARGAIKLVAGDDVEIDIEVAHIDVEMHRALRSIDQHRNAARVRDPAVLKIKRLIQAVADASIPNAVRGWRSRIAITLNDGRTLEHETLAAKGTAENPLTREDVTDKALDLMAPALGKKRSLALIDALYDLDRMRDVRMLRRLYSA